MLKLNVVKGEHMLWTGEFVANYNDRGVEMTSTYGDYSRIMCYAGM